MGLLKIDLKKYGKRIKFYIDSVMNASHTLWTSEFIPPFCIEEVFSIKVNKQNTKLMIKNFEQYLLEGAWGYGSLDNDYVLDDRDELLRNFINATLKKCKENNSGDGNSAWKTIGLLDTLATMLRSINEFRIFTEGTDFIELYEEAIEVCENDENFIKSWEEPNAIRAALDYAEHKLKAYKSIMDSELGVPVENNRLLDE